MSSKIVIVDYGMGNLHSVNKAIAVVGGDPVISSDAAVIAQADKLILPGVGAFGDCMANLQRSGLVPILQKYSAQRQTVFRYLSGNAGFV